MMTEFGRNRSVTAVWKGRSFSMKRTVKTALAALLTLAMVISLAIPFSAFAKGNTISKDRELKSGETLVVEKGETLTVKKGALLIVNKGAELYVKGDLDCEGTVRVRPGGRLAKLENGEKTYWVGPKADIGTKKTPVIALDKGAVSLKKNKLIFFTGLMHIAKSASIPADFTWKLQREVLLVWEDGVKTDANIKGCKVNTSDTQYEWDKVQMGKGASNSATGFESGKVYWWMRNTFGQGNWVQFNYTDLQTIAASPADLVKAVAKDPSLVHTVVQYGKNSKYQAEQSTVPAWTEEDGQLLKDIVYDEAREEKNDYDLYIPASAKKGDTLNLVFCIHGGGWSSGKKSDMDYAARMYARMGYAASTLNFRLFNVDTRNAEGLTMYDVLDDIDACVAHVKKTLTEKGYKVNAMALAGYSAGGHYALLYGYARARTSAVPVKLILDQCGPVTLDVSYYPNSYLNTAYEGGAAGYLGERLGYPAEEIKNPDAALKTYLDDCSPVCWINKNSVPTLMQYGDYDYLVDGPTHSALLESTLKKYHVTYKNIPAYKSDHPLEMDNAAVKKFNAAAEEWLAMYLK